HAGSAVRPASLPRYPWQRERHWIETGNSAAARDTFDAVLAAGAFQAQQCPLDLDLPRMERAWRALDAFAVASIVRTLRELDEFTRAGETHTASELLKGRGIR